MEIVIAAVGKIKAGSPEFLLCSHYLKMARWPFMVLEVQEKRDLPRDARRKSEAELLLKAIKGAGAETAPMVAMDEKGLELSSLLFAEKVQSWEADVGKVVFVIGGADGLDDMIKNKAAVMLSMGRMTMPHFLARAVLAEQIYRARTIIDGHPYHRE